jgi:hypothetical protein
LRSFRYVPSVRSVSIPADLASITNDVGDETRQFSYAHVLSASHVDQLVVVVRVQQEVACVGQVIDVGIRMTYEWFLDHEDDYRR